MTEDLPGWWEPLLSRVREAGPLFRRWPVPPEDGRPSAVLVLLGEGEPGGGPEILILERAADMRTHAGQPAFPGGAADPGDADPAATALREAAEEVDLDPASVDVLATLPPLWISVSNFVVTPVLAWWREPHPVRPLDPAEVAKVERIPVAELVDPAHRLWVRHPSGYTGPAFRVRTMMIWGFTAGVLSALLDLGGWTLPWQDRAVTVEFPFTDESAVP
jgi:8-oxo-dGTP pyrophosphatase MutT (NUDIX family)